MIGLRSGWLGVARWQELVSGSSPEIEWLELAESGRERDDVRAALFLDAERLAVLIAESREDDTNVAAPSRVQLLRRVRGAWSRAERHDLRAEGMVLALGPGGELVVGTGAPYRVRRVEPAAAGAWRDLLAPESTIDRISHTEFTVYERDSYAHRHPPRTLLHLVDPRGGPGWLLSASSATALADLPEGWPSAELRLWDLDRGLASGAEQLAYAPLGPKVLFALRHGFEVADERALVAVLTDGAGGAWLHRWDLEALRALLAAR